jgi:hypothetical protein
MVRVYRECNGPRRAAKPATARAAGIPLAAQRIPAEKNLLFLLPVFSAPQERAELGDEVSRGF